MDVSLALAEAFWNHIGIQSKRCIHTNWFHVKTFARFAHESRAISGLVDLHGALLVRYVEWLNAQIRPSGKPWSKSGKSGAYTALRKLLQWLERCRPGVIVSIEYPFNPFPWRNRDTPPRSKIPARELRMILHACEKEISQIRATREAGCAQRIADADKPGTLGWLLEYINQYYGGIIPTARELSSPGSHHVKRALTRHGGLKQIEPFLYPRAESLLPYYLAIMIHTAGNPDAIAELSRDCLHSLPLLDDRQALVWFKARANSIQRRTFSCNDRFEPPALIKEIIKWNERLRPLASAMLYDRLFLYKSTHSITVLASSTIRQMLKSFCERHSLPIFSLASIRPGVLTSFYRATGDLRRVSTIANHAHLSTTVRYVHTNEVQAEHRTRIAALQSIFIGHIQQPSSVVTAEPSALDSNNPIVPPGEIVSMFGFGCADPYSGVAPGSHRGELCTHFMGCFTCPNAIITPEPKSLARLLQARDHLRAAAMTLHPARWQAFYAPQLRILEEDILTRFSAGELAAASSLLAQLPPLPDLR